jgi:hypothetical protein
MNTANNTELVATIGPPTYFHRFSAASFGSLAACFEFGDRHLDDDNQVIDHEADRQHQSPRRCRLF